MFYNAKKLACIANRAVTKYFLNKQLWIYYSTGKANHIFWQASSRIFQLFYTEWICRGRVNFSASMKKRKKKEDGNFFMIRSNRRNRLRLFSDITFRSGNPVTFAVQQAADLREVAISLHSVIEHGGFHQESVVTLEHSFHSVLVAFHEYRWRFRFHELPHLFVYSNLRVLLLQILQLSFACLRVRLLKMYIISGL